jgi:hypothetical protein
LFFDSWIQFEQKRLPLIQKRADALIRYDAEALDQHETEITANFQEFQEITHFPESFVQEQLNRLCGKPTSDPKRRQVLNYFEGLIQRNDESDYGDLQTATDDVSIIGETDPDVSVEMES